MLIYKIFCTTSYFKKPTITIMVLLAPTMRQNIWKRWFWFRIRRKFLITLRFIFSYYVGEHFVLHHLTKQKEVSVWSHISSTCNIGKVALLYLVDKHFVLHHLTTQYCYQKEVSVWSHVSSTCNNWKVALMYLLTLKLFVVMFQLISMINFV